MYQHYRILFLLILAYLYFGCGGATVEAPHDGPEHITITKFPTAKIRLDIEQDCGFTISWNVKRSFKGYLTIKNTNHNCTALNKFIIDDPNGGCSHTGFTFEITPKNEFASSCQYNGTYEVMAYCTEYNSTSVICTSNTVTIQTTGAGGYDPKPTALIQNARGMLTGCPDFFEPPTETNGWNSMRKNTSGCVSWSSTAVNKRTNFTDPGENETKINFIEQLNNATPENQTNWLEYLCGYYQNDFSKGFPFPPQNELLYFQHFGWNSFVTCSSGFVCYAFVWAAAVNAGYSLPYDFRGGQNGDPFDKLLQYNLILTSNRKIGDIVIYDTNPLTSFYEHVAIITQVDIADPKKDKVISTFGFPENFRWGAKEIKLWDFHSTRVNPPGIFTHENDPGGYWPNEHDQWNLNNIKIVRLR